MCASARAELKMNIDGRASEILHIHPPPRFLYHLFRNSCLINCLSAFLIHLIYIQNYRIMVCLWVEWEFNVCSPCIMEDDYSGKNRSLGWLWLSLFPPPPHYRGFYFLQVFVSAALQVLHDHVRMIAARKKDVSFQRWDLNSGLGEGEGRPQCKKERVKYKLALWKIIWHYLCGSGFFRAWLSLSRRQMGLRSQKLSNSGNLFCRQTPPLSWFPPSPQKGPFSVDYGRARDWHLFSPNLIIQTASHAFINSSAERLEMESSRIRPQTC